MTPNRSAAFALQIYLPEGISFAVPLAGPAVRCLAFVLDLFVVTAVASLLQKAAGSAPGILQDLSAGVLILSYFTVWTLYGMLAEYYWRGQTAGKWLFGLRVMDATGLELQFHQAAIRNLVRSFDLLPLFGLVGGLTMLCSPQLQRVGDLAAGTVVVRTNRSERPNIEALVRGRYNSFLTELLLCARLRSRVPPQIGALAVDALLRRVGLEDRARLLVFDELASYFRTLVEFPSDQVELLTSEQYVRNVVEILYSQSTSPSSLKTA